MKYVIALLACLVFGMSSPAEAQNSQNLKQQFADALEVFERQIFQADIAGMEKSQRLFERLFDHNELGYLAHYNYGRAEEQKGYLAGDDKGALLDHLNLAIEHMEKSTEKKKDFADAYALMASFTGIKAGLQRLKAMFLGPKADRLMDKAYELEPNNPRVVLMRAISDLNKPKFFGGDKERAMQGLKKAQELAAAEKLSDPTLPSWGEPHAHAWMGSAQMSQGDYAAAKISLEKALSLEPNYGWVTRVLMPKLEKR